MPFDDEVEDGSRATGSGSGANASAVIGDGVWSKNRMRCRGNDGDAVGADMVVESTGGDEQRASDGDGWVRMACSCDYCQPQSHFPKFLEPRRPST